MSRQDDGPRISGYVKVERRRSGPRVWVAEFRTAAGGKTRRVLGPAWAKDSGRRTARGGTVWRVADGLCPEGYLTPKAAQAALAELLEAERDKASVRPRVAGPQRTLGDAVELFLRHGARGRGLAATTRRGYERVAVTRIFPRFGESTLLVDVEPAELVALRNELHDDVLLGRISASRAIQILKVPMGAFKLAHEHGWLARNPMLEVRPLPPERPSGDFNVLSPEQIEAVARAAVSAWTPVVAGARRGTAVSDEMAARLTEQRRGQAAQLGALIRIAAYTGLRLGELRALRWHDLDFEGQVVRVRRNLPVTAPAGTREKTPKSGHVRSVPMIPAAVAAFDRLSRRPPLPGTALTFTAPEDLVFISPAGAHVDGVKVTRGFYDALAAASLRHLREKEDPIVFHDLRHTFGTIAVRAPGVSLADVQAWMGHADIQTTMRYVHHQPQRDAAQRLARAFAVGEAPAGIADLLAA